MKPCLKTASLLAYPFLAMLLSGCNDSQHHQARTAQLKQVVDSIAQQPTASYQEKLATLKALDWDSHIEGGLAALPPTYAKEIEQYQWAKIRRLGIAKDQAEAQQHQSTDQPPSKEACDAEVSRIDSLLRQEGFQVVSPFQGLLTTQADYSYYHPFISDQAYREEGLIQPKDNASSRTLPTNHFPKGVVLEGMAVSEETYRILNKKQAPKGRMYLGRYKNELVWINAFYLGKTQYPPEDIHAIRSALNY